MLPLSKLVRLNDPLFLPFVMAGIPVSIFRHFTKDIDQLELTDPTKPIVVANVTLFTGISVYKGTLGVLLSRPEKVDADLLNRRVAMSFWGFAADRVMPDERDSAWVVVSPEDNTESPPTEKRKLRTYVDPTWGAIWSKHGKSIQDSFGRFILRPPW